MALDATKLSAVGYGNGQTLYLYQTNDTIAAVMTSGYFDSLADQLRVGDLIMVVGDEDGTPTVDLLAVTVNDGSAVTVALELAKPTTAKGADATGTNVFSASANALGANAGFIEISPGKYVPYWTTIAP